MQVLSTSMVRSSSSETWSGSALKNPNDIAATFKLLERAPEWYNRRNDEERAELLNALCSNLVLRGESVDPNYRKPFDAVAEGLRSGDWLGEEDGC